MSKLILICLAFVSTILAHPDYSETFEEFKSKYNKNYDSEMEEVWFLAIWKKCGLIERPPPSTNRVKVF